MKHLKIYLIACFTIALVHNQALAQSNSSDSAIAKTIRDMRNESCNFLEVSQEMFRLMSKDERVEGKIKEYFSQLNHLLFLQCQPTKEAKDKLDVAAAFEKSEEAATFKLLMRSETGNNKNLFFKRESGEINEYILATRDRLQYISTTLDITSIREMMQILSIAGEAGGL